MMPMSPEKRRLVLRVNVVCLTMVWLASSTALVINGHLGVEGAVYAYLFIGLACGLLARMLLGHAVWKAFSKSERASSIVEESAWPVRGLATLRRWWPIVAIGLGVVLFILTILINVAARSIVTRLDRRTQGA